MMVLLQVSDMIVMPPMRLDFFCRVFYIFFLLIICLSPDSVSAQDAGVSLRPATIEETVDPGTVKQYSVEIKNLNSSDELFYVFTRNITGVKGGGTPVFATNDLERTGYELSDWITLPYDQILVEGNGSTRINFVIDVPENATPGSHFGGIFVSVEPPKIEESGASVGYQVANIISLRISGDVDENASIRQFSTNKFLYGSQNVEFSVRIENSGNVLVRPVGPLEINNMLGKNVATILFNEQQSAVFPQDTRTFENIFWKGDSVGFGRYEAILSPGYGDAGAKKTISSTVTFWILPMNIIGPALAILAFLLLVVFMFVRLYIKRSLAHMNYGRRIVRRRKKGGSSTFLLLIVIFMSVIALFLIVLLALFA